MNEHYWAPHTSSSNEYSSSRTFQRTSSAADTLAEATALLTELEAKDGEVNTSDEVDDSDNKLEGEDWEKEGMTWTSKEKIKWWDTAIPGREEKPLKFFNNISKWIELTEDVLGSGFNDSLNQVAKFAHVNHLRVLN